jgi:hypothetical protein
MDGFRQRANNIDVEELKRVFTSTKGLFVRSLSKLGFHTDLTHTGWR